MLKRTFPISVSPPCCLARTTWAFQGRWRALSVAALLLLPASPAFSSVKQGVSASTPGPLKPEAIPSAIDLRLNASSEQERFRSEFKAQYPDDAWSTPSQVPSFLLQRGEYRGPRYGFSAEMGDLLFRQTPGTLHEAAGRGGRLGFLTGTSGNTAKLETFAASGVHGKGQDDTLVGATGEISLLDSAARFKTILLSGRHSLDEEGRWPDAGERTGDVVGFLATVDPFDGKLTAEAELDYAAYDKDTSDKVPQVRDNAYRIKVGGGWGSSSYCAVYEHTGPRYRLMSDGPARDREGLSLGMATAFRLHAFDVKVSRYNDNTDNSALYPRLYRYEGLVDYRFKGFKTLPMGLQYRKAFIDSAKEPLWYLPKEVQEEAVTGQMNYLTGRWDLGLRGTLTQRINKLTQRKEAATQSLGFHPKFAAGPMTVVPDLSLKRVTDFSSNVHTDHYGLNLGLNGKMLRDRLDYEVKGGYNRIATGGAGTTKEVIGAKVKAGYPLARFFNWTSSGALGVKGEYKAIDNRVLDRRENDFSLLISLDGVKFM